ncbi:PREDICTED: alanine racemase-like [Priapulus caudatus]|uniref:Alanine racemase-like n=1 Tax=Priapulus caudatus TaxID=37621 RepID=A0ABM1EPG1_PRICU|nr:PREDICTED: alanine racemase-like [Priapulus caudatus]
MRKLTMEEIIGVVRGHAYGHGAVRVARHLASLGVETFAVATTNEGRVLRNGGVQGKIHVLGNCQPEEINHVVENDLIPTICWSNALKTVPANKLLTKTGAQLKVNVNVDSGLSMYGVETCQLDGLIQELDALDVGIESIFTHFAGGLTDRSGNLDQLDHFLNCTDPYVNKNISRHAAASVGCCQMVGTELDYVRPGRILYGISTENDFPGLKVFKDFDFLPAMSVFARPTFYERVPPTNGRLGPKWLASFACGWADGYSEKLSHGIGSLRNNKTGQLHALVGRVTADECNAALRKQPRSGDTFTLLTADYADHTSPAWMACTLGDSPAEVTSAWSRRVPRVYVRQGEVVNITAGVDL